MMSEEQLITRHLRLRFILWTKDILFWEYYGCSYVSLGIIKSAENQFPKQHDYRLSILIIPISE